jgi:hypothetical protein
MTTSATAVWEYRGASGNNDQGGGYDSGISGAGTDYSQQDAAQLSLTDCATSGAGVTTLTSAAGGFTAAMIGNTINISAGTNLNIGTYWITARTDTNTVTLNMAPDDGVGGVSGGTGKVGGAFAYIHDRHFDFTLHEKVEAGNTLWIKNETMTLVTSVLASKDGSAVLPIKIQGYNTTRGDNPTGTNRPLIVAGALGFEFDNFYDIRNLRLTTTATNGLKLDHQCLAVNVKVTQSSGSVRSGIETGSTYNNIVFCEASSTNGYAISAHSAGGKIYGCYAHGSFVGIDMGSNDALAVIGCIADTCTHGIRVSSTAIAAMFCGNTLYNNTTGLSGTSTGHTSWAVIDNLFKDNTTAIGLAELIPSAFLDYNLFHGNGTDIASGYVTKGDNTVSTDPVFTDAANADFSIGSGSGAINGAFNFEFFEDLAGTYKRNIGFDQNDPDAGGGGATRLINGGLVS